MDDKQPEEMDSSTMERRRGLSEEIPTETADVVEETSVELASISTARNYRHHLASVANDDDGSVT